MTDWLGNLPNNVKYVIKKKIQAWSKLVKIAGFYGQWIFSEIMVAGNTGRKKKIFQTYALYHLQIIHDQWFFAA